MTEKEVALQPISLYSTIVEKQYQSIVKHIAIDSITAALSISSFTNRCRTSMSSVVCLIVAKTTVNTLPTCKKMLTVNSVTRICQIKHCS
jgi:hypothetical protein